MFLEENQIIHHSHEDPSKYFGAVVPPIFQNSLFVYEKFEDIIDAFESENEKFIYARGQNPSTLILEKKLADLEHAESAKCFSSGMGAISATFMALLEMGSHVLFVNNVYGPAQTLVKFLSKFGVESSFCLDSDMCSVEFMIQANTKMIYFESPGTFIFKVLDIEKLVQIAKSRGILTVIDNSWATPLFLKPLDWGVDLTIHSASKYLGGHSDIVGGVVAGSREIIGKIFKDGYMQFGARFSQVESALLLRSLRTLPLRMKRHEKNVIQVAEFLGSHKLVKKVNFIGHYEGEEKKLVDKYFKGYSGLFSFELVTEEFEKIKIFINSLKIFQIGVSWGGFESLVMALNFGKTQRDHTNFQFPVGLIRLSIGHEEAAELIFDLNQALQRIEDGGE
ncbi:MAG: aminotransferase class I/II-fold pyridoxal phosphate-dependent enzyme [Fusobacteria bacterium]|nr:aminotransferase class I/II-fold pyridoxal phosphate-dependent enzyme [Fusobacteriota bacterium]